MLCTCIRYVVTVGSAGVEGIPLLFSRPDVVSPAVTAELREREVSLRKSLDLVIQLTVSYTALVLFLDMFPQVQ